MSVQIERAVFLIQSLWRDRRHRLKITDKKERQQIKLIYTSIAGQSPQIRQNNAKMDLLLHMKRLPVTKIDLTDNKQAQQEIKQYKTKGIEVPYLFIDGIFIGSYEQVQLLEDSGLIEDIVNQNYLQRCLVCNQDRRQKDQVCSECGHSFTFFDKSK